MKYEYEEKEANASTKLTYLLVGGGIGAILALLFAPKSCQELRGDIKLSQNDRAAARTAYEKAMALGPAPASKDLLQRKLDDLAGAQS